MPTFFVFAGSPMRVQLVTRGSWFLQHGADA
jgi:hypothetical protein